MLTNNEENIKFGIRAKLLLPLFIGLFAIICVLLFVWQPSQLNKAKQEFIKSQTNILKTLNPSLVQNILSNDLSALHSILENSLVIHKDEWRYLQLKNINGLQIYPIFMSKPKSSSTLLEIILTLEEDEEVFGEVRLFTDWEKAKNNQTENINKISLLAILFFILLAATSYVIQTRLIYIPITRLKDITSQLSHGNYKIKLPAITMDEVGVLTISIDQMRQKIQYSLNELADKEKMQRAIVDSVPDAIITMNKQGIVKTFNFGAENIFQYPARDVVGNNIKMLMPEKISQHHNNYLESFNNTSTNNKVGLNRTDLFGKRKDGSHFPIELSINTILIDGELLFTGILRDITERKQIERLKDEFISTVSHELRTPLTAIKGSLDIIIKGLDLELPETATTMFDITTRNVDRLLSLINDILDISKLESGEINFQYEDVEIKSFIEECIELNHEYATKHNTDFICTYCNENIYIHVDKDRLNQVMSNLLSNAAKYSPANINVEIFTHINNDNLRVSVKDYGKGIPDDFQSEIFDKFTQSSSGDTRQVGGTGLGLNISKMIIEKFGGEINFETVKDKETTFYFELPIVHMKKE